jgi:predicted enzyme related to lactoylglutathione lyase
MKVNSISGIHCYVKDLSRTAKFYETIGFRRGKQEADRLTFYVNWFFVTFISQDAESDAELKKEAKLVNKGSGLFLYIKVDDIKEFYKGALSHRMKPLTKPQKGPSGGQEFVLRDPDGYKLVFFQKN